MDKWVKWEDIMVEVDKLRAENPGEDPVLKTDEKGHPLPDPYVLQVLKAKVDAFLEKKPIGELLLGPGMSFVESREIRYYARQKNLRAEVRQCLGEQYILFTEKFTFKELAAVLMERKQYGKYLLVDNSELPMYDSIKEKILRTAPELTNLQKVPKIKTTSD